MAASFLRMMEDSQTAGERYERFAFLRERRSMRRVFPEQRGAGTFPLAPPLRGRYRSKQQRFAGGDRYWRFLGHNRSSLPLFFKQKLLQSPPVPADRGTGRSAPPEKRCGLWCNW